MPMHDWTTVGAGIFHAFHHRWISAINDDLNGGKLPQDYYALPEQVAAGFGPDVLTLQERPEADEEGSNAARTNGAATKLLSRPITRFTVESESEFYRRRKSSVVVRQNNGDRVVAMIEIVSPGNKSNHRAFETFVDRAWELLELRIHLLIVDPFPPTPRDPRGIHAAIWEADDDAYQRPADEPLTFVSYECDLATRAHIEPAAVGQKLPDMPLYLAPHEFVRVPLEATYNAAFAAMPLRWRKVLDRGAS